MRKIILAVALATSSPAIASEQFDLICTGSGSTVRYRVDLAKGEACSDTCDRVWKMGPSTTGQLKLIDREPAYRGDLEERSVVNRVTGEWDYYNAIRGLPPVSRQGKCEPASFSGFPTPKF